MERVTPAVLTRVALLLALLVGADSRGADEGAQKEAKLSKEQMKEAARLDLPVVQEIAVGEDAAPLKLVLIPAGSFWMGTSPDQEDCDCPGTPAPDERPAHAVRITRPFYIGRYEVTQAQYEAVTGKNPSRHKGKNLPVERLSWFDAKRFCEQLSTKTGHRFRLPTEAEWEYACRAGKRGRFWFGADPNFRELRKYAWFGDNSGEMPHPVGEKAANPWGLYDILGNAPEWCNDRYDKDYYAKAPLSDPPGPAGGRYAKAHEQSIFHVMRGGSWEVGAIFARPAARGKAPAKYQCAGLRIVLEAPRR